MAAEVPAKDVLCEAMEYLTKLGSNLRTRSENLRQKKIRREKLNNALAVQKAASKVLLICELSKKSLENVENGVRRVLQLVDSAQAPSSDGGKNKETSKAKNTETPENNKQYYIKYKSRKLKIKDRISFKHYNSVRVNATGLPQSMIDKYPVYHDCKLYRMRKKLEQHQKQKEISRNKSDIGDNDASIISIPDTPDCKSKSGKIENKSSKENNVSVISIPDSPESKDEKIFEETGADEDLKSDDSPKSIKEYSKNVTSEKNPCKAKETAHRGHRKMSEKEKYLTQHRRSSEAAKASNKTISEIDSGDEEKNKHKSFKRIRVSSSSDERDDTYKHSDQKACQESDAKKMKLSENSNDAPNCENSNDSMISESRPMIKCVSLDKLLKPSVVKPKEPLSKPKNYESDKKEKAIHEKFKELEKVYNEEEKYWIEKRKEVKKFKPKKLVINIVRLPEITPQYLKNTHLRKITKGGITICEIHGTNSDAIKQNDNEAYLESNSRRNSSHSFDDSALIDEANKVKNSLLNESDTENEMDSDAETKSSKNETEVVKNQLLNDSDSDSKKSDDNDNEVDKTDEACSNDREALNSPSSDAGEQKEDSGNEGELEKTITDKDNVSKEHEKKSDGIEQHDGENSCDMNEDTSGKKISSNNENKEDQDIVTDSNNPVQLDEDSLSESQKNDNENTPEKKAPSDEDGDVAKLSLLDNSSEEKTKVSQGQTLTHQSKKRQTEAKKMLLNHSSSEAEDEASMGALTDIKNSLLHGSDEETREPEKKRETSQSSSEEDFVRKVKKKKELKADKKKRHKYKKHRKRHDSEDSSNSGNFKSRKMVRSKSKPGNSSCQSSDAPDTSDKDIDGLTNLTALNKTRRRNSNSSEMEEDSSVTNNKSNSRRKTEPTGLISGDILNAESSEESAAGSAGEHAEEDEDMLTMTVPSFNGADHLEKENLLEESDSSASHNEDNKTGDKEESEEEEKPNSKRRKAIAISSDSEVGSSRKKDADFGDKLSDFEDSEDSDVANKRSKRKKKAVDSDASVGSNSSNEGGKKKRRRIKSVRESEGSGSESETEGRNKHGRKNIRKVMGKNQLEEATKKAARREKERIARIAERQKMYNNLQFDESGKPDEVVLDKVVLDFDPETKEPLIEVDRGLVKKLKPHQANGIKFMWDACFESVKRIKKDRGSGCILAHCMGLGKTLQVVTLTHTLLTHGDLTATNRVLVVCPLSTVLNWVNEFRMWLKYAETEFDVDVYELSRYKQNSERAFQLSQWFRHGGVCVLGYEMFRNLSADNGKKFKKKMLKNFQEALVDPGPDLVVCDEGHLLKNEKTSLSQSMNRVRTLRRIVLTGTPLQNNLKEYYCMVQFVKPNLLGKYNEYLNRFVNPITNGQYTDSTEHDIKIMKRRSHVLHKMLDGAVQRRDYGVLAPFLPPKHEYVLFITLSEVQTKLYQHYLDNFSRRPLPGKSSGFLFPDFQSLQRIWTHPLVLKYNSERYEIMQQKKRDKEEEEDSEGSLRDFIDDDSTSEESMTDDSTDDSSEMSDDSRKKSKKKKKKSSKKSKAKDKESKGEGHGSRPRRGTRANPVEIDEENKDDEEVIELKNENPTEWWIKLVTEDELEDMRNSHKLVLLFDILRQCEAIGDKLLVFSQSLYSLDLIEHFLDKVDNATQEGRIDEKLGGHIGTWSPGVDYFRLDGSTSCENRSIWCKNFNREDNPRARLFLISTRAGGLGINLVAANRVVIFDVSWNPSHDVQSIFRVYRFGQKKPCYVYRFLAMGTMEEKIYERQVTKQAISKRVIDEQQIDRHYAENDLAELYKFEPQPPTPRPIPPLPKDRLFAEMLREHEAQIYKYHEHDSLLENKEEETLSEEERKAAWEDFENEKNKPPPAPFPSTWQMNMLQQQQLAYAALAAMLRKDMPNVSDNQLRDMIPLIYNSNPQMFGGYDYGLMQKMSEIYKYTPMMNPGMMNPGVMNAGVGGAVVGAGGMSGGASGLQYEPPWQRQQQHQQQMRLQQLLQQQNPMGAKFYAGGLGSRDPVAMALQHQRAREIMMGGAGGGASRPRGRPPMQPRAPPSADVVNLDSD